MLPVAKGNPPHLHCIHQSHTSTIVSQTIHNQYYNALLGNAEALARKNARSDHVFLDFLVTFFIKKKGKNKNSAVSKKT